MIAALEFLAAGFNVTAVEKRSSYVRTTHLSLRQSFFDDLNDLDPVLHEKLLSIATPIEDVQWLKLAAGTMESAHHKPKDASTRSVSEQSVEERLHAPKAFHVQLRELETLFAQHLQGLATQNRAGEAQLKLYREFAVQLAPQSDNRFGVAIVPSKNDGRPSMDLGVPDLVLLTEGGKGTHAAAFDKPMTKLSGKKYYLSAHVSTPLGPITRRVDSEAGALVDTLQPSVPPQTPVSLWATGHGESSKGTWIVMEVPEPMRLETGEAALEYFLEGSALLFGLDAPGLSPAQRQTLAAEAEQLKGLQAPGVPANHQALKQRIAQSRTPGFSGIFTFEQQMQADPRLGSNVLLAGDGAGMGHHHFSTGLEMGIIDRRAFRAMAQAIHRGEPNETAIARAAEAIVSHRVALMSLGLPEYYTEADFDTTELVRRSLDQGPRARETLESLLAARSVTGSGLSVGELRTG